jgi:hypothetical protein
VFPVSYIHKSFYVLELEVTLPPAGIATSNGFFLDLPKKFFAGHICFSAYCCEQIGLVWSYLQYK